MTKSLHILSASCAHHQLRITPGPLPTDASLKGTLSLFILVCCCWFQTSSDKISQCVRKSFYLLSASGVEVLLPSPRDSWKRWHNICLRTWRAITWCNTVLFSNSTFWHVVVMTQIKWVTSDFKCAFSFFKKGQVPSLKNTPHSWLPRCPAFSSCKV